MFLRNLLFLCLCVALIAITGLYVYPAQAAVVWGLLFLCWICYRLKLRARNIFEEPARQVVTVPISCHREREDNAS